MYTPDTHDTPGTPNTSDTPKTPSTAEKEILDMLSKDKDKDLLLESLNYIYKKKVFDQTDKNEISNIIYNLKQIMGYYKYFIINKDSQLYTKYNDLITKLANIKGVDKLILEGENINFRSIMLNKSPISESILKRKTNAFFTINQEKKKSKYAKISENIAFKISMNEIFNKNDTGQNKILSYISKSKDNNYTIIAEYIFLECLDNIDKSLKKGNMNIEQINNVIGIINEKIHNELNTKIINEILTNIDKYHVGKYAQDNTKTYQYNETFFKTDNLKNTEALNDFKIILEYIDFLNVYKNNELFNRYSKLYAKLRIILNKNNIKQLRLNKELTPSNLSKLKCHLREISNIILSFNQKNTMDYFKKDVSKNKRLDIISQKIIRTTKEKDKIIEYIKKIEMCNIKTFKPSDFFEVINYLNKDNNYLSIDDNYKKKFNAKVNLFYNNIILDGTFKDINNNIIQNKLFNNTYKIIKGNDDINYIMFVKSLFFIILMKNLLNKNLLNKNLLSSFNILVNVNNEIQQLMRYSDISFCKNVYYDNLFTYINNTNDTNDTNDIHKKIMIILYKHKIDCITNLIQFMNSYLNEKVFLYKIDDKIDDKIDEKYVLGTIKKILITPLQKSSEKSICQLLANMKSIKV